MSRYGSQATRRMREPVAVTCEGCGQPTTDTLYIGRRPPDPDRGEHWDQTTYRCADCGPEWRELLGHKWEVDYPHVVVCAWCRRVCSTRRRGRRYCTSACTTRARTDRRRQNRAYGRMKACSTCRQPFTATRQDAAYCSSPCRQRAYRHRVDQAAAKRDEGLRLMADYDHGLACGCGMTAADCLWRRGAA
jgi:hypothetical protein